MYYILVRVRVCVVWVGVPGRVLAPAQYAARRHIVICDLSGSTILFDIISRTA